MSARATSCASFLAVVSLLASFAGCGDDGDEDGDREQRTPPVAGTYVGKLRGSDALVAVVVDPPAKGQTRRQLSAFVCDAERRCAWYTGSADGNDFVAKSSDGTTEAKVKLKGKAATGSVELPGGETARYNARAATATSGIYDLTVSRSGKVRGASAAGVGLTGHVELPPPGSGNVKLADGTRLRFKVTEASGEDAARLRTGQLRLIVLPDGEVRGAGKSRGEEKDIFFASGKAS